MGRSRDAERQARRGASGGLSWKAWAADLDEHLRRSTALLARPVILGGGVSKAPERSCRA
jgi:hypothetical protein